MEQEILTNLEAIKMYTTLIFYALCLLIGAVLLTN